ncbi:GNAT family N-acetyltransferase [Kocuria sp.]|uniref:GNAT family N-acetyltransferase n=1 Tax=Kocuria sp. TaxID=1871328 RepID=UPI0026DC5903|nr:GNAT family protein [Kocuria sp.]MDO4918796.1 GNAT family protein [Kocuria sp.]
MAHSDTSAHGGEPPAPRLRPLRLADAPDVLAAFLSDPAMARQGTARTLAEAETYVRRVSEPPRGIARAVCVEDRAVGLVGLTVDRENASGWFWYWMTADARGRGWTSRAAATVADWALTDGGLARLELGHRVNNPASGAVARAAGFVREGTEREKFLVDGHRVDVAIYGRLRTDPWPVYWAMPTASDDR